MPDPQSLATFPTTLLGLAISIAVFGCSASDGGAGSQRLGRAGDAPLLPDPSGPGDVSFDGLGDEPNLDLGGNPGSGCATSVSGTALDPSGRLPLYNVVAYVPSEPLSAIVSGASCETCDGDFSGRPIAATVSDAAGVFRLDLTNVPARQNVPLVIQAGKWRRAVTIPEVPDCADTALEPELTRLPRSRAEGNLPRVAVMRAGSDALECLFHKIGVDPSEFTPGGAGGSVELYYSDLENAEDGTGLMSSAGGTLELPLVDELFSNYEALRSYDMLLLSCEGGDERYDSPDLAHRDNLQRYANEGGRLFGGHYHNGLIDNGELPEDYPEFPEVVDFASGNEDIEPQLFTAQVNQSFEKGRALAEWLVNVGGSSDLGRIQINDSEKTVEGMIHPSAVSWIDADVDGDNAALYYGFPTPVDGPACGRMVFTDVHLASGSGDSGKEVFPSCSTELSPQQLALAFLIFDLANCVQTTDTEPPPLPIIY